MRTFYLIMSAIAIFASSIVFGADPLPKRPKDLDPITAAALNGTARWLVDGDFGTKNMTIDELKKSLNVFPTSTLTISNLTLSGAGTGILFSTTGNVGVTSNYVSSLAGTTNQVSVSSSTGAITISLPQNIHTAATPTFAGMTLGTLTGVLKASSGVISGSATTSDLPQGSNLYYTDTAARAALFAGSGIGYNNTTGTISNIGVTSAIGTAQQVTVSSSTGAVTFGLPQNISTTSSPTFNLLKVTEIIDGQGSPVTSIDPISRVLRDASDRQVLDWLNRTMNGTTNNILDWNDQFRVNGTQQTFNFSVGSVGAAEFLYLDATANAFGIGGNTSPTALLHLSAGTTTAGTAPLKFTSGPLLSSAEAGAVEFLADAFYGTITTGDVRKAFIMGDPTLTATRIPFATTNGRLTDTTSLTWGGTTLTIGGTVNATAGILGGLSVNGSSTLNGSLTLTGTVNLATGSTTQVPIMFNAASALTTTPATGYYEFAADKYYGTITTGTARKEFSLNDIALTAGRIPFTTTNGRLSNTSSMTYTNGMFEITASADGASALSVRSAGDGGVTVFGARLVRMNPVTFMTLMTPAIRYGTQDGGITAGVQFGFGRSISGAFDTDTYNPSTTTSVSHWKHVCTFSPTANAPNFVFHHMNPTISGTSSGTATVFAAAPVITATGAAGGLTINILDLGTTTTDYFSGYTSRLRLSTSGTLTLTGAANIVGSLQADSIVNDTGLAAGTYTPTRSAESNLDSNVTPSKAQYSRVGSVVTVSGRFTADPTSAGATSFEITLPVASNFAAVEDCAGVAASGGVAGLSAEVTGSIANDKAVITWIAVDTTSKSWSYHFSYEVK